ncbi:rhomboid family intramembrane serine protease [Clostridium sp. BL-8]|uniref:rhomboid family intramembrane serine protease n=1 Tax=Clostridium sp. BL-8 TaxID=349938 RepID=UPI00098C02F1|nr:rhomboid family intramembrane serine protease [Clostridium sp. BL-8]OOM79356.1 rhomboid protease GluP [Clostridium sp. BL-8]
MNGFKEEFYRILINRENFYMKQYYSGYHKEERYIAIKELRDGIYCVLISETEDSDIDSSEAFEYIRSLGKSFSLNVIILSKGEYTYTNNSSLGNKLIINTENNSVIQCDNSCIPLRQIFEGNLQINERKNGQSKKEHKNYNILTFILIGINIVVFLLTAFISGNIFDIDTRVLIYFGAKINILIDHGEIWRLLTCAFLHSGLIHIVCNMYSLYIIGPQIEQIYGIRKYLSIYLISCITASISSYFLNPNGIAVGASGGIFGLMGALLAFALIERNRIQKKFLSSLLQIIAINLFIGLSIKNIDNFAHIGGLVGGIVSGYISYILVRKKHNKF